MKAYSQFKFQATSPRHSVELLDFADLTANEFLRWDQLAQRSLAPNPFNEPGFVRPLVDELGIKDVSVLVVLDQEQNWEFAVPVVQHHFEQGLPLAKFRSLRSPYTFLDQPLVAKNNSVLSLTCLLQTLASQRNWHGIGFFQTVLNSDQRELFDFSANACGLEVHATTTSTRPCVRPQPQEKLLENISSSRRKTLRKGWRRLEKLGVVEFRLRNQESEIPQSIQDFLRLESMGWKGDKGTAMSSQPSHLRFFSRMCEQFAREERVFFGEIVLNSQVVASTCNLHAGDTLFAFKIGWNPSLSECSLGYWSEILLADAISRQAASIQLIDSCSEENSYTGKVWPEKLEIGNGIYIWSRRAKIVKEAKTAIKLLLNRA